MISGGNLVGEAELKAWLGYERRGDVLRVLNKHKINYFCGRGGRICTTVDALNSALNCAAKGPRHDNDREIDF